MPSEVLHSPGTKFGPCIKPCQHKDCETTRQRSKYYCHLCNKIIGYDAPFYKLRNVLVHTACVHSRRRAYVRKRKLNQVKHHV